MAVFKKFYARHYDLLYKDKDYRREADFFNSLIKKYGLKSTKDILSFGAGTVNHEQFLVKKGYVIDGVELSAEMVMLGKSKIKKEKLRGVSLVKGDMRDFSSTKRYDAVLAMFNIVAYCKGLKDMERFVASASKALKPGGVLVFDCWNAVAARRNPPQNTWTKMRSGKKNLYKLVQASKMNKDDSFVRTAELMVVQGDKVIGRHSETHVLYTWEVKDLKRIFHAYDLKLVLASEFMNHKPITNTRWSMAIVAKKLQ